MRPRLLTPADTELVRGLLLRDPVANVFVSARVDAGVLWPSSAASLWGWPADRPRQLLHAGSNLVPVIVADFGDDPDDVLRAFAEVLGPRRCHAIVGPAGTALALFERLGGRPAGGYSRPREIRAHQPLMIARRAVTLPAAPVVPITIAHYESYVAAAVSMYTEEVGQNPLAAGNRSGYRAHCRQLIETGRAFGIVTDGHVVFKADVGAASGEVAQIQGVWLAPHLRGRGLAAPAMAAATAAVQERYPVVSLYVNDFNVRAVRAYERAGYDVVDRFATVLY